MIEQERRRYFRINDSMKMSYRLLAQEELETQDTDCLPQSPVAALSSMDKRIKELVQYFDTHAPEIAELCGLLNKKIDSVIELLAVESGLVHRIAYMIQEVNVSACGIAFKSIEAFTDETLLLIDMVLAPTDTHISAIGKVLSCGKLHNDKIPAASAEVLDDEQDDELEEPCTYFLRVDFEKMSVTDQEILIQHLVKRQAMLFRAAKKVT